ncbi:EcsC family protein [Deltaproteobacteria bacterium TL4]
MSLDTQDYKELVFAKQLLEAPSLASKLNEVIGSPLERGFALLPDEWNHLVQKATQKALYAALEFAFKNLGEISPRPPSNRFHKLLSAASGATGGALGIFSLPVELPISTIIMLRSIGDIARSEHADLRLIENKLACLEVFALGNSTSDQNVLESSYYLTRAATTKVLMEAAEYLATRSLAEEGSSVVLRLIATLTARFGFTVSSKVAASAVPIIGAASGALINTFFIEYFQTLAHGHFIIKRLERRYDPRLVEVEYQNITFH